MSGAQKTGKTALLLSIAEAIGKGDSGAQIHWFDSEDSLYDSAAIVDPLIGSGVLVPTFGSRYEDFKDFVEKVLTNGKDDDWVMVDKADAFWKWTQKFYTREVKGKDLSTAVRDANKGGASVAWGGVSQVIERAEWSVVNDYYDEVMLPLIMAASDRPKLHLAFVTEVKDLEEDDPLRSELNHGVKPTGQKSLPYQMRTLVHLEYLRNGHVFSTVERHGSGREREERVPFTNFALGYLVQRAGWTRKLPAPAPIKDAPQA